ncbi:MAG: quinohemoprotein amine dehydrogenase maturase, partial [Alphaproteobacteria bacterium]|nr:quinohemoprotein amine dehydrogenase maturase [Alphaproteobacteria bacterium]
MPAELQYISHNAHDVTVGDQRILFHVPTTSLFDLDDISGDILDLFKEKNLVCLDDMVARFEGRYAPEQVQDV